MLAWFTAETVAIWLMIKQVTIYTENSPEKKQSVSETDRCQTRAPPPRQWLLAAWGAGLPMGRSLEDTSCPQVQGCVSLTGLLVSARGPSPCRAGPLGSRGWSVPAASGCWGTVGGHLVRPQVPAGSGPGRRGPQVLGGQEVTTLCYTRSLSGAVSPLQGVFFKVPLILRDRNPFSYFLQRGGALVTLLH